MAFYVCLPGRLTRQALQTGISFRPWPPLAEKSYRNGGENNSRIRPMLRAAMNIRCSTVHSRRAILGGIAVGCCPQSRVSRAAQRFPNTHSSESRATYRCGVCCRLIIEHVKCRHFWQCLVYFWCKDGSCKSRTFSCHTITSCLFHHHFFFFSILQSPHFWNQLARKDKLHCNAI